MAKIEHTVLPSGHTGPKSFALKMRREWALLLITNSCSLKWMIGGGSPPPATVNCDIWLLLYRLNLDVPHCRCWITLTLVGGGYHCTDGLQFFKFGFNSFTTYKKTTHVLFWPNPVLLNWRPAIQWSFPIQWVFFKKPFSAIFAW